MAEPSINIELGDEIVFPKYESSIPRNITEEILSREQLPKVMPPFGSSIIEDFILNKLKGNISSPDLIAEEFANEDITEKIRQYIEQTKKTSNELNWDNIFSPEDAKNTQLKVTEEMAQMGMDPEQIKIVTDMKLRILDRVGSSDLTDKEVTISRFQIVRKALDYIEGFGDSVPLDRIVGVLVRAITAHELGHKVNDIVNVAINNIPNNDRWKVENEWVEKKGEKFAEYWAGVGLANEPTSVQIKNRVWLMNLGKVTQLWDAVSKYNGEHDKKADLLSIFRTIREKIGPDNKDVLDLLDSRILFYGGNEVESYASSYSREIVAKSIK